MSKLSHREKADEKAVDTVIGMTTQLITLGTAVLTVVVGILGLFKSFTKTDLTHLTYAVGSMLVSVVFGLFTYGAVIAELDKTGGLRVAYSGPVRVRSVIQWFFFLLGLGLLLWTLSSYQPLTG